MTKVKKYTQKGESVMKKFTFGTPEEFVPTKFCKGLNYVETDIKYDTSKIKAKANARGFSLLLPMGKNEEIFGFGLQHNRMNFSRAKAVLRCNADPLCDTGDSHAPVPFFVSTAGYGIYFDTARAAEFDIGAAMSGCVIKDRAEVTLSTDELYEARRSEGESVIAVQIPAAKGIDIYIFEGETITDIVAQYNMFSGGGCDVPEWGLGLLYRMLTPDTDISFSIRDLLTFMVIYSCQELDLLAGQFRRSHYRFTRLGRNVHSDHHIDIVALVCHSIGNHLEI